MPDSPEAKLYRQALVQTLKKQSGLLDPALEAAFQAIPRHVFLPEETLEKAYSDEAIAIKRDNDGSVLSSSSQPSMMAIMLRQLRLREGDNVLEIGTGSGYNAAIMQHVVGERGIVTSVDLDHDLTQQANINLQQVALRAVVNVVNADGAMGYAPRASYDRIIATAAIWDVPPAWERQLKNDGILVAPIWLESMQVSAAFVIQPDGTLFSRQNIPCGFIQLRGMSAGPTVQQRISGSTLVLSTNHARQIDSAAIHLLLSEDEETVHLGIPLSDSELWRGFLPYLTLNTPSDYMFVHYAVGEGQKDYGLSGSGFALVTRGSACFVPYGSQGEAHSFAGADAFMALQEAVDSWDKAGRPGSDHLRLRLIPHRSSEPVPKTQYSKTYARPYHNLQVWLEN